VIDVDEQNEKEETSRVMTFLDNVKSIDDLDILEDSLSGQTLTEDAAQAIKAKRESLTTTKKK